MTARSIAAAAALAVLAAACATAPTPYGPATTAAGYGYAEQRIEADRYAVRFKGNSDTDTGLVQDYALLRAAEITLRDGYEWFQVVERSNPETTQQASGGPRVSVGVGGVSGSRGSGVSTGVGVLFGGGGSKSVRQPAALEIKLGRGEKPDSANVYDARSVVETVGRRAARPAG